MQIDPLQPQCAQNARGGKKPSGPASIRVVLVQAKGVEPKLMTTGSLPLVLQHACSSQGGRDDPTGIERIVGRLSQQARRLQGRRDNRSRI